MNYGELEKWHKENANCEEKCMFNVIEKILYYHNLDKKSTMFYPRKVLTSKKERIEFDLLISYRDNRERIIGIEFKEMDFQKAVFQAIVRRNFLDYIYVAIQEPINRFEIPDLFLVTYYGIGLIVWSDKNALLVLKSKMHHPDPNRMEELLDCVLKERLKRIFTKQEQIKTLRNWLDNIKRGGKVK